MEENEGGQRLELISIEREPLRDLVELVILHTSDGDIRCVLHLAHIRQRGGVVYVGGAGGGLTGPAGGLYPGLAEELAPIGISSLRLDYRVPNDYIACVLDTMMGISFMRQIGLDRLALIGHSFGGAVVISAAAVSKEVVGAATLATQSAGTDLAAELGQRALFLAHGADDTVLPELSSREVYSRVSGPKDLHIYPGCGHNFDECGEQLRADLLVWIRGLFMPGGNGVKPK